MRRHRTIRAFGVIRPNQDRAQRTAASEPDRLPDTVSGQRPVLQSPQTQPSEAESVPEDATPTTTRA